MGDRRTVDRDLGIVVLGASGDLARRKIFPALFWLYCQDCFPDGFHVVGFARSDMTQEQFRERVAENLTCRYTPEHSCAEKTAAFLARCHYHQGQYGSADSFLDLYQFCQALGVDASCNRAFFLAIPPDIFLDTARAIGDAGLVACGDAGGPWSRAVIEKPFGHDRASSDALTRELASVFTEPQTYRIDHYLGKEVIQNLMVLRFANVVFEPLWNSRFIESIEVHWSEDLDVAGRGGYFDRYGIVRDVMQNHLLQIMALVAMERPVAFTPQAVRNEKVRLLRAVRPVGLDDMVLGQYGTGQHRGRTHVAYRDDPTVSDESLTATFAAARLHVDTDRWRDTRFIVQAGKGLSERMTEIRVQFRRPAKDIFAGSARGTVAGNRLVIRVQPDEAIRLHTNCKLPGLGMEVAQTDLDLTYRERFESQIPDAYECLLLDVLRGDKSLFIRGDELRASWDIFTPVLHRIDADRVTPHVYAFGSSGPDTRQLYASDESTS